MENYERCNDCGNKRDRPGKAREDVCSECMDLRGTVTQARMKGEVSQSDFEKYQKALRGRSYRGREIADALIAERNKP